MVDSVSSSTSITQYQALTTTSDTTQTEGQEATLEEILANYDAENMTDEDFEAMMQEIEDAGIAPSEDLKETLDAAGFEPPAPPEGEIPPAPEEGAAPPDFLTDFLESEDATEEEQAELIQQLQQNGYDTTGLLVDTKS